MDDKKHLIVFVTENAKDVASIDAALKEYDLFSATHCGLADHIDKVFDAASVLSIILDLDSIRFENRSIKKIAKRYPETPLLSISQQRFHPHLKEAISEHLFACLVKPIDPDELHYFLKCILENGVEKRGPPVRA